MPAPLPKVKLSELRPSAEELRVARENIQRLKDKESLSKKACLRAYLKQNPDNVAKGDMGELLEKFVVLQSRAKENQKSLRTTQEDSKSKGKFRELHWWSQEQMDKNLGEKKATSWRESNLLPSRPDRVTGKNEDPFKEYGIPEDWEQITETELKTLKAEYELEVNAETMETLEEFKQGAGSSGSGEPVEKSQLEVMAEKIEALKANLTEEIKSMQDKVLTAKLVKTKADASGSKYHSALIADCAKVIIQGEKMVKLLERMVLESTNDAQMPKVINQLEEVKRTFETVSQWAETYGFAPQKTGDGAKRRRKSNKKN